MRSLGRGLDSGMRGLIAVIVRVWRTSTWMTTMDEQLRRVRMWDWVLRDLIDEVVHSARGRDLRRHDL